MARHFERQQFGKLCYMSGFSEVRISRFPSRNYVLVPIHHKPALVLTVCLWGHQERIPGQLSEKPKVTWQQQVQTPPKASLGHPSGDSSSCSPLPCPFLTSPQEAFWNSIAANLYLTGLTMTFAELTTIWKTHCLFTRRKPAVRNIPQCLCFLQLLQNSLVAPKFCPLCHQSCRSNANWIPQGHSFWQI